MSSPVVPARFRPGLGLFWAVFHKRVMLLVRYPVDTLGSLGTIYLFFALIFFGGRAVGGPAFDDSLGGIVVGYFLAVMGITAYQDTANNITDEAQWGTLEQLYMSPLGFGRVMLAESIVNVIISFVWGIVILALMILTTGQALAIDLVTVIPIATLAILSTLGLGFVFAGAAVLYKRISNVFGGMTFVLLAFAAAPVTQYPLLKALPLSQGSYLLRRAMDDGVRLWEFAPVELGILAGVAVGYLVIGYATFVAATRRAQKEGVMGHY